MNKKINNKRINLISVLMALSLMLLTACGGNSNIQTNDETRIITDGVGREVEIPEECNTIACVDAFAGEVMVMTGGGEKMCCCPGGVKSDDLLNQIYPDLENVTVVQSGGDINAEALLDLKPDVILLKEGMYEVPEQAAKIDKLGIPYLVTKYADMDEQINMIRMIGEVAGGSINDKANDIATYYEDTIKLVEEKKASIPEEDRVSVYHAINSINRTDGPTSLGADWIDAVGCKNVSVGEDLKMDGNFYTAGSEQVFVWDPDFVICNDFMAAKFFKENEMFAGLRAVQEGNVYNIPVGATRWGQEGSTETFFGMLWLGKTVYPEAYSDFDLKAEVFNFYENTLGITLDDETYEKIISGQGIRQGSNQGKK